MSTASTRSRIAFAVDFPTLAEAEGTVRAIASHVGVLKIGLELYLHEGSRAVSWAQGLGFNVFLDLKLHDIPKTVERAVENLLELRPRYLTVHASGGSSMLKAAAHAAAGAKGPLTLLAVTVLTSLDDRDLQTLGLANVDVQTLRLATLAKDAGIGGVVCSPLEISRIRSELGPELVLATPGVRLAASDDDQKRVASPEDAIRAGATLLVVGRPIRDAVDPAKAAADILASAAKGLT